MDRKKNSFVDEEERINLSNSLSKDESKMAILKKEDDNRTVFNKLNKQDSVNASSLKKSLTKSSKGSKVSHASKSQKSFKEDQENENVPNNKQIVYSDDEVEHTGPEAGRRLTKREKICDTDTEDEGSDNEKDVKWIILPENSVKRFWDLVIALIILYSSIVTPYKIAFIDDSDSLEYLDIVFDILFFFDVIINFFAAYVDNEDNVIKNRQKIFSTYLKTWFLVDIVSIAPVSYFTDTTLKYNNLTRIGRLPKLYRLLKLTKLLRMSKIAKKGKVNRITKFFLEKLKVNANIERLIYFILSFLLLNHLSACIWFFVAKLQDLAPDCWVTRLGYIDSTNFEIYVISFYWTLTTVTTVGYGDVNAGTTVERAYNLVIMSFGVLMYSFAIGSLSSIVSTLDAKTAEMNQKLQILSSIKKEFNLDQDIYDKVRKVIKYDLSRNQKDKMNFLQELPNKLRIELSQIMHDKVIQNLYFFRDQPSDFIAYVAPLLKPVKFSQNDYLYKSGDMIDEMYFVSKGTVILCLNKEFNEREVKEIKKNNNFGEIEMCLNEKLTFNIKIKSRNCELFVLKKNDFLRLSVNFKEFIENFLHKSLMIYLKFNEEKKKILREEESKIKKDEENEKADGDKQDLEVVDEEGDEDASEYDINSEFDSDSKSESTDQDEDEREKTNLSRANSNIKKVDGSAEKKDKEDDDEKSDDEKDGVNLNDTIESEEDDPIDKMKNQINKKFIKKIDKILDYLDKNNINFNNLENNPKVLLKELKSEVNILEKNHIIDKIENILKDFYKDQSYSKEGN